jgi:hypothetical protein
MRTGLAIAPRRSRLLITTVLALIALACLPAFARASASWQSGPLVESQDNNCITGDPEYEAGSYMSYYTDPANPPKAGDVYYVAIDVTGIGNTCAGIYADVNMILPSGTSLAISSQHPVICYLGFPGASSFTRDTADCPQSLPAGIHGYEIDPFRANPPFWPLPQGGTAEIQVPVTSSTSGTQQFEGVVQLADGEFDPTLTPSVLAIVNPAAATTGGTTGNHIGIYYQTPSISGQSQPVQDGAVSATFTGWVQNNGNDGSVVAQLAKADSAGDCSSPTQIYQTGTAALQHPNTEITGNFTGLYPGGAYCWRFVVSIPFGTSSGTYTGNWEYFATIGSYISANPNDPNKPPPAAPVNVQLCSSNGSGCATSNCNSGATCSTGGGVGGLSHLLHVAVAGTGSGRVSAAGGIACPSACSRTYPSSASPSVTLTAVAAAGSKFAGWSGGGCSGTGTCTVKMNANQSVTATFSKIPKPVPKCSVSAVSRKVPLKKPKHGKAGQLSFKVTCDQQSRLSLSGVLTEKLSRTKLKTFHLGPAHGSAKPGRAVTLSLKLPSGALKGLKQGHHESLAVSLTATSANGTGRASLTIGTLKHSG